MFMYDKEANVPAPLSSDIHYTQTFHYIDYGIL